MKIIVSCCPGFHPSMVGKQQLLTEQEREEFKLFQIKIKLNQNEIKKRCGERRRGDGSAKQKNGDNVGRVQQEQTTGTVSSRGLTTGDKVDGSVKQTTAGRERGNKNR